MFLTRIELGPRRRLAQKYLGSPQVMHAVVMKTAGGAVADGPGRVLWRVDRGAATWLYVLSPEMPDCRQLLDDAGPAGAVAQTLDYEPFLSRLEAGQVWAFRLAANPSRAVSQGPGERGKQYGHVTVAQQRQWLVDRAERFGFQIAPVAGGEELAVDVVRRGRPVFGRNNPQRAARDKVTINQTVYEGLLRVSDPAVLRQSLVSGMGRSKAYGCGLMTLARPVG